MAVNSNDEITLTMTLAELIEILLLANAATTNGPLGMTAYYCGPDRMATLQRVLERHGYEACSAVSLARAIEHADRRQA